MTQEARLVPRSRAIAVMWSLGDDGLEIKPGVPFGEWERLVAELLELKARKERELHLVTWWLADAIRYGEAEYGERYAQAVEDSGLSYQRLANIVWVAEKFPPARRRMGLTFEHHARVAALPPEEADALLDEAEAGSLSTRDLWDRRVQVEAERNGRDIEMEQAVRAVRAARAALERLEPGRRASLVWFELVRPLGLVFDRKETSNG